MSIITGSPEGFSKVKRGKKLTVLISPDSNRIAINAIEDAEVIYISTEPPSPDITLLSVFNEVKDNSERVLDMMRGLMGEPQTETVESKIDILSNPNYAEGYH